MNSSPADGSPAAAGILWPFGDCSPIRNCGDNRIILLSPLPCYITVGSCTHPNHAPNRALGNFRSTFTSGLEGTNQPNPHRLSNFLQSVIHKE